MNRCLVGDIACDGRPHGTRRPAATWRGRSTWLALALLISAASPAAASSYYVDNTSASCSPNGPGTEAQPYCTISAAVTAHSGLGVEIIVKPGIYRETVTVPASGSAVGNYVLRASAPGVVVTGADDFSGAAKWTLSSGTVYLASTVNWSPFQVFVDASRLIPAAAGTTPSALAVNNFVYVSGQGLYVNLGGPNPGTHATEVGHRLYAFRLSAKSYVTIQGFHATRTEDRAIYLSSNSNNCIVRGNQADFAYRYGIAISTGSGELIEQNVVGDNQDHGIALTSSSTGCTVQDNESYRNVYPTSRAANGIYLNSSTANLIRRNRLHNNQDTGVHLQTNSDNNISVQNVSYNNGDHGFDHLFSQNTVDIGNVAYGNYKDGFSIEGTSPGTHLHDCIAINNGLNVASSDGALEYDLWVDSVSSNGFVSDYNIFWNSTSQYPVKFISTRYTTVAAYSAATGQDAHSVQADPKFMDPATANFHLQAGSPAIDNAISSVPNWPATDADGLARVDDPATANLGSGVPNYADRGAFEFQASGSVPTAALTVTPSSGTAPLFVTADGSGSTDTDGTVVSYRFDFGDGTVVGPQPGSSATHTYAAGSYTVTLQVTDNLGHQNTTSKSVTVVPPNQTPDGAIDSPAANLTIGAGQAVNFTATGIDPDNNLPLSYSWNFGGGAANVTVEDPGPTIFNTPGTYNVSLTVTDGLGAVDPTPATRAITVNPAPTTAADEIHWTFMGQTAVTFDWRGYDNTIRYGLTAGYGNTVTAVTPSPIPFSSPGPFWEARLTGLLENTVYHYSVGTGPDHVFHTPPPVGSAGFRVYAEGDIGDGSHYPNMLNLQNAIAADLPAFTLMVGDLTYGNTNGQVAVDTHFNNVMVWSQDAAYMPAWGNHEYESPTLDDLRNYKGRFDLPNALTSPNSPTPGGEDWYWFDYGNVRFIAYPEPWSGAWADWATQASTIMDQAQADPNLRYIVTIGHQPAYSSGFHAGETTLKNAMDELGDSHSKYVLNLNGHSHDYERSYPQHGVTHITTGTGGSELEGVEGACVWGGGCPPPSWSAFRAMHHVRFRLTFNATGIRGEALCGPTDPMNDMSCAPGTVIDSFDIDTPFHPPVVTAPAFTSVSEGSPLTVNVTASDADGDAITSLTTSSLPAGASFIPGAGNTTGTLSWSPDYTQTGSYTVTFTASNALSGYASTTITVNNVDRAPAISVQSAVSASEGTPLTLNLTAADPDGEALTSLIASGLPPGATFTPGAGNLSGALQWTPSYTQHGVYTVTFTASNALSSSSSSTITVGDVDAAPVVTAPATATVAENGLLAVNVSAEDPDGDGITSLLAAGVPSGATFTPGAGNTSGTLSWTPDFTQAGSYSVTFTASNSLSGASTNAITVTNVDRAPSVTAPATASVAENTLLTMDVTVSDPDGDAITSLTTSPLPAGATFTPGAENTSGTLSWTPGFDQAGSYTVTFTASNALAGSSSTAITVTNVDRAPLVSAPATVDGAEGSPLTVDVTASDPDGDAITSLTATGVPAGASFTTGAENTSGTLSWTPGFDQAGSYTVTFTASNALAGSSSTAIPVTNVDRAPLVSAPATVDGAEGSPLTVDVTASDPDGDAITSLTATGVPAGASFTTGAENTSGTLSWTPGFDQAGSYTVTFTASNALAGSSSSFVTVINVNGSPEVSAPAGVSVAENALLTVNVTATDPDGDGISSLTTSALPAGATFTPGTGNTSGTLSWTPGFDQTGSYTVTFTAANALSGSSSTVITVTNTDRPPLVTAPATEAVAEGSPLTVNVTATDPDGDAISSLTTSALPAGATFTPGAGNTSGTLSWTPGFDQAGSYTVTFTAANALSGVSSTAITVTSVDAAPVVTAPASVSVAENSLLTVDVTAGDPDGEAITSFSATGLPSGATFTPGAGNTSGTLSWTPTLAQAGTYTVTFTASNALSSSASTTITVTEHDQAPVVTAPATASIAENALLTVNVTAADADGDAITSLTTSALPPGATFTPGAGNTSGTLSWTPTFAQSGSYTVTFTASNALSGSASTTITVGDSDRAPAVSAPANASVAENALLTVNVTVADPDGDAISSLAATGLPSGASFTPGAGNTSGTLSWTPTFAQSGSYTVTFTASNALTGSASTTITVTNVDRGPVVTAPAAANASVGSLLTVNVTAADPDDDAISSLTATGIPAGASFTPGAGNTTGTLSWTPPAGSQGSYSVTFTASNALTGSATTVITVQSAQPPVAALTATPVSGNEPLTVSADASASTDADGSIVSYDFAFGDNNSTGAQAMTTTSHTYYAGTYTLTVTVTDNAGLTNAKAVTIVVAQKLAGVNLATNPSFEVNMSWWNAYGTAMATRVAGGFDGAWSCSMTSTAGTASFGLNDTPSVANPTPAAGTLYRYRAWVRSSSSGGTAKLQVREFQGSTALSAVVRSNGVMLTPNWQLLTLDYTCIAAGTTVDFQVLDFPLVAGETFQVDNISVYNMNSTVGVGDIASGLEPLKPMLAPSPMHSSSSLTFLTTRSGRLEVGLFDLTGRRVRELLHDSEAFAGVHRLSIDGKGEQGETLPSGMYFYRIDAAEGAVSGRFIIAR